MDAARHLLVLRQDRDVVMGGPDGIRASSPTPPSSAFPAPPDFSFQPAACQTATSRTHQNRGSLHRRGRPSELECPCGRLHSLIAWQLSANSLGEPLCIEFSGFVLDRSQPAYLVGTSHLIGIDHRTGIAIGRQVTWSRQGAEPFDGKLASTADDETTK